MSGSGVTYRLRCRKSRQFRDASLTDKCPNTYPETPLEKQLQAQLHRARAAGSDGGSFLRAHRRHSGEVAIERNRVFACLEIAGIAKEIPTVGLLVSCFAEIGVRRRIPRQPALDQHRRVNRPSLEHLSVS